MEAPPEVDLGTRLGLASGYELDRVECVCVFSTLYQTYDGQLECRRRDETILGGPSLSA